MFVFCSVSNNGPRMYFKIIMGIYKNNVASNFKTASSKHFSDKYINIVANTPSVNLLQHNITTNLSNKHANKLFATLDLV